MRAQEVPSPVLPRYAEQLELSPWLASLDKLYRQKCDEVTTLEAEVLRLKVTVKTLRGRLANARRRLDLWDARHEAWKRERKELLG